MDLAISVLAFAPAFKTPLPRYRDLSPSRNSSASCSPVDAPDGTAARPTAPDVSVTSASTVGFPRESITWRACTRVIFVDIMGMRLLEGEWRFYRKAVRRSRRGDSTSRIESPEL